MDKCNKFDFTGLTDIDLIIMQYECRKYSEDAEFVKAIMMEMSRRVKSRNAQERNKSY